MPKTENKNPPYSENDVKVKLAAEITDGTGKVLFDLQQQFDLPRALTVALCDKARYAMDDSLRNFHESILILFNEELRPFSSQLDENNEYEMKEDPVELKPPDFEDTESTDLEEEELDG